MVKVDVNGKVVGFGLVNDGATSKMLVEVDEFAILKPGAAAGTLPALSVLTTPQTINGVTIPAGVYIDGASIAHLTAGDVVARGLSTDSLVAKAGTIFESIIDHQVVTDQYIGDTIQSTVYAPGPGGTGWMIDKAGTIRGQGIVVEDASITTAKIGGHAATFSIAYPHSMVTIPYGTTANYTLSETSTPVASFAGSNILVLFTSTFYFMKYNDFQAYECISNVYISVKHGDNPAILSTYNASSFIGGQLALSQMIEVTADETIEVKVLCNTPMRQGGYYDVNCYFSNPLLSLITLRK